MKTLTAVMTGLITCTTVLHAQSVFSNSLNGSGKLTATTPVVYRELRWTNGVSLPSIDGQNFAEGGSYNVNPIDAEESDLSTIDIDYQVIILSHDNEIPGAVENEAESIFPSDTGTAQQGIFTADKDLSWKYGALRIYDPEEKGGTGNKIAVQNLFIEPLRAPKVNALDRIRLREYTFTESHRKPAWYEWVYPRVFIPKWTELWTTETDATPVVLVLIRF